MANIKIGRMVLSMCQTNCYFVYKDAEPSDKTLPADEAGELSGNGGSGENGSQAAEEKEVVLVDPADQGRQIYEALKGKGFRVSAILLTHGHFDHIWGANELRRLSGAPIYAYEEEKKVCENAAMNVSDQAGRPETVIPDHYVKDGELLEFAGMRFRLIATPGHTAGSCCYYMEEEKILFSGDTLFEGSVGRTDFPTGSMSSLVRSIKDKLLVLPEDVTVYPGHGEKTTIGDEKKYNPYCQ